MTLNICHVTYQKLDLFKNSTSVLQVEIVLLAAKIRVKVQHNTIHSRKSTFSEETYFLALGNTLMLGYICYAICCSNQAKHHHCPLSSDGESNILIMN
jgi:hypothetical protein